MITTKTSSHEITLSWTDERFQASLTTTQTEPGIDLVHIKITAQKAASPPLFTLSWSHPAVDIHANWLTSSDHNKGLKPDWTSSSSSKATSQAPICSLYSFSGQNKLTFAFSDALNMIRIGAGVSEETAMFRCNIQLFVEPTPPMTLYEATLRLDTRDIPYYESLEQVQQWWASFPDYKPAPVPEVARQPLYSTWYSFHQQVTAAEVEEQCRLAKALGCEAVIVDDGWQTTDNARGYAYTGDWEVTAVKIPDMKAHVARVHALGMKYILWYSVPFVGIHSKTYARFSDKLLYSIERLGAGVLDPRYPEVREYIINTYEQAMREWDLDGFKLDFVDSFSLTPRPVESSPQAYALAAGQDYLSVPEAVDRLLTDIIARLRQIKPDVMVEFRQSYIGPLMRKYGNMFRASDCPNDALTNRERTIDIRLLCGDTAAHADMLMWNENEPVESAALQVINILFSVPQISVLLHKLPSEHLEMVRFWLAFWHEHRDVLLDGKLMPLHPETFYPLVQATTPGKHIAVMYQDTVVNPGTQLPDTLLIVNGTLEKRIVLELTEDAGESRITIRNCRGQIVQEETRAIKQGWHGFAVPAAGILELQRAASL
jgi:alpha-galactosidase